jgi:hypothetical protein
VKASPTPLGRERPSSGTLGALAGCCILQQSRVLPRGSFPSLGFGNSPYND